MGNNPQEHDHDHHHHHGGGRWQRLMHPLRAHSHDPAERVDRALETSDRGIRALKISLFGLGVTAILQVVVVAISGSVALLGDTLHNFADALTSVPLWIAFNLGRRPRTRRYTYGFGKAEDIAGLFIVLAIATSTGFAAFEAIQRLIHPQAIRNVGLVATAGVIGFIGNELVAIYRIRIGREIGSAALVADGLHSRTDGLTSLAVVAGAIGVAAGFEAADPVAGLAITVTLLFVLKGAARDVFHRLMDAVDPELVDHVERVTGDDPRVRVVDDVRLRWTGHSLYAAIEISIDPDMSVSGAHDIALEAEHRLIHEVPRLTSALVHINPLAAGGQDPHEAIAHHRRVMLPVRKRSRRAGHPSA